MPEAPTSTARPRPRWPPAAALGLLLTFALFALHHAWTAAPTFDEVAHLPAGMSYWKTADGRLNREHPPLVKLVAGLPPLLLGAQVPIDGAAWERADEWRFGTDLLFRSGNDPDLVMGAGRSACVGFGLLLGAILWFWGRALAGPRAALLPVALVALSPLFVAHGSLVTTDVAAAAFLAMTSWGAWRCLRGQGADAVLTTALGAGCLVLTKFTAPAGLAGVGLAVLVSAGWRNAEGRRRALLALAAMGLPALLTALSVRGWPPDPRAYLAGIAQLGFNHQPGWSYWAFGSLADHGRWWYFPAALLVKAGPGTLLGLALGAMLAVARSVRPKTSQPRPDGATQSGAWTLVWVPAAVYGLVVVFFAPNVGVRYALPALALLLLALAALPGLLAAVTGPGLTRWIPPLLMAAQLGGLALAWPHPLPWFNGMLGCGTGSPRPCLDDSNLDWGQGLTALGRWSEAQYPGVQLRVAVYCSLRHEDYVNSINMRGEELLRPNRAVYAMSAQRMIRPLLQTDAPLESFWFHSWPADHVVAGVYHVWDLRRRSDLEPLQEAGVSAEGGSEGVPPPPVLSGKPRRDVCEALSSTSGDGEGLEVE